MFVFGKVKCSLDDGPVLAFHDKEELALSAASMEMASIRIDLPAPVSPVNELNPD